MSDFEIETPRIEVARNAVATAFTMDKAAKTVSGCLYDVDGRKLDISERFGGHRGDHIRSINLPSIVPPHVGTLRGRSLYLGNFMGRHYGHFLLESLSSIWALDEVGAVERYIYHPFIFGTRLHDFARDLLVAAGVNPRRLTIVEEPVRLEQVVIPSRLFRINHSAHPLLRRVYARIALAYPPTHTSKRIYISRTGLKATRKRVGNEIEVETLFKERGFEILHPQNMTMAEQIPRYLNCDVLSGFSGSGLHNIVFAKPGTTLIVLGDRRNLNRPQSNQKICAGLVQAKSHFIPFKPGKSANDAHVPFIAEALEGIS